MESPGESRHEESRRLLREYVHEHVVGNLTGKSDPEVLARLVNAAPAKGTLGDYEWWNVALLLAMGYARRAG